MFSSVQFVEWFINYNPILCCFYRKIFYTNFCLSNIEIFQLYFSTNQNHRETLVNINGTQLLANQGSIWEFWWSPLETTIFYSFHSLLLALFVSILFLHNVTRFCWSSLNNLIYCINILLPAWMFWFLLNLYLTCITFYIMQSLSRKLYNFGHLWKCIHFVVWLNWKFLP